MSRPLLMGSPAAMRLEFRMEPPDEDDDLELQAEFAGVTFDVSGYYCGSSFTLTSACIAGVDLLDLLSARAVHGLEADALDTLESRRQDAADDAAEERAWSLQQ